VRDAVLSMSLDLNDIWGGNRQSQGRSNCILMGLNKVKVKVVP